jgi:quercetin dioxygenase-like cupin family protein
MFDSCRAEVVTMGSAIRITHARQVAPEEEIGRANRAILPLTALGAKRLIGLDLASYASGGEGPTHDHTSSEEIFYILRGKGQVILGGRAIEVKAGDFIAIPKGILHQVINKGADRLEHLACYVDLSLGIVS